MERATVLVTPGSWVNEIVHILIACGAGTHVLAPGEDLAKAYHSASHVLIPGGADLHPREYGERVLWARPTDPERDRTELQLARWALAEGKPLMGICRGHQVITVAAGGTLHQDIRMDLRLAHDHGTHTIRVHPGSRVGRVMGVIAKVNSYHHQAVKRVPQGWRVVAESFEGAVVESIEHPTLPVLSVQWHPEVMGDWELFATFLAIS